MSLFAALVLALSPVHHHGHYPAFWKREASCIRFEESRGEWHLTDGAYQIIPATWAAFRGVHVVTGQEARSAAQGRFEVQMTPGLIDLSINSVKGASAACAIPKEAALALADELRRVAS